MKPLSPEEAHAINRLMDPMPKVDPLRRYIPVYRAGGKTWLSGIAFETQIAAWRTPRGPNVPESLEIIDVLDVRYPEQTRDLGS